MVATGPLLLLLLAMLLLLMGPRDVMSGDDAIDPLCDFFDPLDVFEFDRPIYTHNKIGKNINLKYSK